MAEATDLTPAHDDKPAPMPLLRVQTFINTLDVEEGTDALRDPDTAAEWLSGAGLVAAGTRITPEELREARAVRDGLRALVGHNSADGAPSTAELAPLRSLAQARQAAVRIDSSGRVELGAPEGADLRDGLLSLLLTVRDAQADGTWSRLKLCANPECAWAFYDRSRNRQGAWCTMAACGNRLKNRRFRARGGKPASTTPSQ